MDRASTGGIDQSLSDRLRAGSVERREVAASQGSPGAVCRRSEGWTRPAGGTPFHV
ncbi:MAG: hypothetical protein MZU79_01745 [Anaerotruncus sp.]|nr:hypothetical protein [Anaerotruncus sp.]